MTPRKGYNKDLTGKKFGLWTVLSFYGHHTNKPSWLCKCDCKRGTIRPVRTDALRDGSSASCGCTSICLPQPPRSGWIENGVGFIPLTQGKVTEVDAEDVEELQKWKWQLRKRPHGTFYAERDAIDEKGKKYKLHMARYLMGLERSDKRQVDHRDLNPLNNKKSNLRVGTQGQNLLNKRVRKDNRIGVKGVVRNGSKTGKIYSSKIIYKGVYYGLGSSDSIAELAQRYAEMSRKLHGEFGRTE